MNESTGVVGIKMENSTRNVENNTVKSRVFNTFSIHIPQFFNIQFHKNSTRKNQVI